MWTYDSEYAYLYGIPYVKLWFTYPGCDHWTAEEMNFVRVMYPDALAVVTVFKHGEDQCGTMGRISIYNLQTHLSKTLFQTDIKKLGIKPYDNL